MKKATVNEALEILKSAALEDVQREIRKECEDDLLVAIASIDWGSSEDCRGGWRKKLDDAMDSLAEKSGGHESLGTMLLYMVDRLCARGLVDVKLDLHEKGEDKIEDIDDLPTFLLFPSEDGPEETSIFFYENDDCPIGVTVTMTAN